MVISAQDFQKWGTVAASLGPGGLSAVAGAQSAKAAASGGGFLAKAHIMALEPPGTTVFFMFNPSKYTVSRNIMWSPGNQKGVDVPDTDFVRGQGRTIKLELFADEYETGGTVLDFVEKLESLTLVNQANAKDGRKARPPQVLFGWGGAPKFKVVITSLNVTYTLFHPDGRPARATINLGLQEVKNVNGPQNPTSGGEPGRHTHVVLPGETLDLIAHQELGDARHWPHIAETNGVDNPFAIRPGQSLTIAPVR